MIEQIIASLTKSASRFEVGWKCTIDQVEGLLDNMSLHIFDDDVDADTNHVDMNGLFSPEDMEDSLTVVITAAREALTIAQQAS